MVSGDIQIPDPLTIPLGDARYPVKDNPAQSDNEANQISVDPASFTQMSGTDVKAAVASFRTVEAGLENLVANNDHRIIASASAEELMFPKSKGAKLIRVRGGPNSPEYFYVEFNLQEGRRYVAFEFDVPIGQSFKEVFIDLIYSFGVAGTTVLPMKLDIDVIPIRSGFLTATTTGFFPVSRDYSHVGRPYGTWKVRPGIVERVSLPTGGQARVIIPAPTVANTRGLVSIPATLATDDLLLAGDPLKGVGGKLDVKAFASNVTVNIRLTDSTTGLQPSAGLGAHPRMRLHSILVRRVIE